MNGEIAWAIETSKDSERWRFFGKAWTGPGEPLLLHGVPRYLRFKAAGEDAWSEALERTGSQQMTMVDLDEGVREELWPGPEHEGLPVVFPGGQEGRLLRFEHDADSALFTWAVEFRGMESDP